MRLSDTEFLKKVNYKGTNQPTWGLSKKLLIEQLPPLSHLKNLLMKHNCCYFGLIRLRVSNKVFIIIIILLLILSLFF